MALEAEVTLEAELALEAEVALQLNGTKLMRLQLWVLFETTVTYRG